MASMSSRASMSNRANSHKPYFDEEFCKTIISDLNTSTGRVSYKYRIADPDIYFHVISDNLSILVTTILDKINLMNLKPKKSSDKPKNSFFKRASKVVKNAVTRKNNKTNKNNNNNNTKKTDIDKLDILCRNILLYLDSEEYNSKNEKTVHGENIKQQDRDDVLIQIRTYLKELCNFFNNKKFFNFTEKGKTKVISIVYVSLSHIAYIDYQERISSLRTSMLPTARPSTAMSVRGPSTAMLDIPALQPINSSKTAFSSSKTVFNSLTPEQQELHNAAFKKKIEQNLKEKEIHVEIRNFLDDYIKTNNLNDESSIDSFSVALNDFLTSKKKAFNTISTNNPIKIFDRADKSQFKYYQLLQLLQLLQKTDKDYKKIKQNITEIIKSNP